MGRWLVNLKGFGCNKLVGDVGLPLRAQTEYIDQEERNDADICIGYEAVHLVEPL